ncbi:MAG: ATP-binding protein, partial [Rhodocyclaceae bacterium]
MDARLSAATQDLDAELAWLAAALQRRLDSYFGNPPANPALPGDLPPPSLINGTSPYAEFVAGHALSAAQRLVLALALAPLLRPQLLDVLWARNPATQRGFAEFGGVQGGNSFIPTAETACFLLAGDHLGERLKAIRLLTGDGLATGDVLQPLGPPPGEALLAAPLRPAAPVLALFGADSGGDGETLPAQRVTTGLEWSDLVLPAPPLAQLEEVRDWLNHGDTLLHVWGMHSRL